MVKKIIIVRADFEKCAKENGKIILIPRINLNDSWTIDIKKVLMNVWEFLIKVMFLCEDATSFINGVVIPVDSGCVSGK